MRSFFINRQYLAAVADCTMHKAFSIDRTSALTTKLVLPMIVFCLPRDWETTRPVAHGERASEFAWKLPFVRPGGERKI